MELKNNTILITGGTSGFGLEFAKRFLELGNTVIITGRNPLKLDEVKEVFPEIDTFQSDVSEPEEIEALFEAVTNKFPKLNVLINNAGEMRRIVLHDHYSIHDITREIEINLMGPVRMVQQFLPHLKNQETAAILNVTSNIALMTMPIAPIYSASKSGLSAYTRALRVQLKNTNIKVIELLAPGSFTPLNEKFRDTADFEPGKRMLMAPDKIVETAINGMRKGMEEIYPGPAKIIYWLSRIAPKFLLSKASKMGASLMHRN